MFDLPVWVTGAVNLPFQNRERVFSRKPITVKNSIASVGPDY
jgi:hypothetical protein